MTASRLSRQRGAIVLALAIATLAGPRVFSAGSGPLGPPAPPPPPPPPPHGAASPNDPEFPNLWGLLNVGQSVNGQPGGNTGADISAVDAWKLATGSPEIIVAVISTGIDYTHPDLAANVWSAPKAFTVTVGGQNYTCPKGSHGFDVVNLDCDPMDDNGSGTHTAGVIGAVGNNKQGVTGVAWKTRMVAIKVLNASGAGSFADVATGLDVANQMKRIRGLADIRVLANPYGGGTPSQAVLDEITEANGNEMLFLASAGNGNQDIDVSGGFPASADVPNVVAVMATDNSDFKATFSSFGATKVHLAAPGVQILSTWTNGTYRYLNGVNASMAYVAGAAALVLSRCDLDTPDLKAAILDNVDVLGSLFGLNATSGRLNAGKAVRHCKPGPRRP